MNADTGITDDRKKVWRALFDLFLDTELSEQELNQLGAFLAGTGYSLAELKTMLLHEVGPVLIVNLFSAAGVWDGFDKEWLSKSITGNMRRKINCNRLIGIVLWPCFKTQWMKIEKGYVARKETMQ